MRSFTAKKLLIIIGVFIYCLGIFFQSKVFAGLLSPASVRLTQSSSSKPISALLCLTPSSASSGTEGQINITFPNSFNISQDESDWLTSSSNLPSGSTPIPGISSQATIVSTKTVTFTISDLASSSDRYCINIESSNSDTGSTTGSVIGQITTKSSGGSQIDYKGYSLSISESDQVTVSATVPANPTDFEAVLTKTSPDGDLITHSSDISYQLSYQSLLSYPVDLTIEAEWELGTMSGSSTPSVDLLDYIPDSASNGYNNTTPIIDTVNRTIRWEITALPVDLENQTVTFQLRTKNIETSTNPINFKVKGRVIGPGTQSPNSTVSLDYLHGSKVTYSSSNNTSSSINTTPTSSQIPTQNRFLNIEMYEIDSTSAILRVATSQPSWYTINFGLNPQELNQTLTTSEKSNSQLITLQDLLLDTPYYFKVTAKSDLGNITSDIYTFRTPQNLNKIDFDPDSLIVTANEVIIFNNTYKKQSLKYNFFTIPKGTDFTFQLAQVGSESVDRILAYLVSDNVLGATNDESILSTLGTIQLVEVRQGVYLARISTPLQNGNYTLALRVYGSSGSITVKNLAQLRILDPMRVVDEETNQPIERARIRLLLFNYATKLLNEVMAFFKFEEYPLLTDINGSTKVVLPPGKYRAEVKALGYNSAEIDFTIGQDSSDNYPLIKLKKSGFSVSNFISYHLDSFFSITTSFEEFLSSNLQSRRFYQFVNLFCILTLITLTTLSLSRRIGLPLAYVPIILNLLGFKLFRVKNTNQSISGNIIDAHTGNSLTGVHVFLLDGLKKIALDNTISSKSGSFTFKNLPSIPIVIRCEKQGYLPFVHLVNHHEKNTLEYAMIVDTMPAEAFNFFKHTLSTALERFTELLLIGSIVVEIAYGYSFGWLISLPFLLLSTINLLYYFYYHRVSTT